MITHRSNESWSALSLSGQNNGQGLDEGSGFNQSRMSCASTKEAKEASVGQKPDESFSLSAVKLARKECRE